MNFLIFRIESYNPLPVFFPGCIGQPRLHRHHTDIGLSFNIRHHILRDHPFVYIHCIYKDVGNNVFFCQQTLDTHIILWNGIRRFYCVFQFCTHSLPPSVRNNDRYVIRKGIQLHLYYTLVCFLIQQNLLFRVSVSTVAKME